MAHVGALPYIAWNATIKGQAAAARQATFCAVSDKETWDDYTRAAWLDNGNPPR